MDELLTKIEGMFADGMHCSQIMLQLACEMRDKENPDLIRAMGGLGGGLFKRDKICGSLLGGCAIMGLYGAKSGPEDEIKFDYKKAVMELTDWYEGEFGSIICNEIVEDDRMKVLNTCPAITCKAFIRCMEMLDELGIDTSE